jgi:cytochrome c1
MDMKKRVYALVTVSLLLGSLLASFNISGSSATGWHMEAIETNIADKPSLQRGARLYIGYCLGCHSLKYQRYERTANDLEIPLEVALDSMIFTGQKIGGLIETSMPDESKEWFGGPPPDLTMVARVRGNEWLYNYLKTFYVDESRPFGVNNKVFPNVGMPHALLELQGIPREACEAHSDMDCLQLKVDAGTGIYDADQYDQAVYDIVNFLDYVGEPSRLERERMGIYVLLFLIILGVFTYLLNREFWKDIH